MTRETQTGGRRRPPRHTPRTRAATGEPDKLVAKMIYLPADECAKLEQEAREVGHNGISQYVRWILAERRRTKTLGA